MRRFILPDQPLNAGQTIPLPLDTLRHIHQTLRLTSGQDIELCDGRGRIAHCRLQEISSRSGSAHILTVRDIPSAALYIELIQGIAKGEKLDMVLQKGTELGANSFILTSFERSISRLNSTRSEQKKERWQKITREAARQCGQAHLPKVTFATSVHQAIRSAQGELKLMLWEQGDSPLPAALPAEPPTSVSILIGPEGGISPSEAEDAQACGFKSVKLGHRIMRTETAGLAIISILQYVYGDLATAGTDFRPPLKGKGPL